MNHWPENTLIYEVNTWVWLSELGQKYGRRVDLGSVPSEEWESFSALKINTVWLMGVWERSPAGIIIALRQKELLAEFRRVLPDFTAEDVVGSPYCVRRYVVDEQLGGPKGLAAARKELAGRGIGLVLDFVPNHTAQDSPWIYGHPEYFIQGSQEDLTKYPSAFFEANCLEQGGRAIKEGKSARHIFACGRDPYFPPWNDVAQVNAFDPAYRRASIETLRGILEQCDGVRCDMAILLMNAVFEKTWGQRAGERPLNEYWVEIIEAVRKRFPDAVFIAEAYWDLESQLHEQGFDFCYDKMLYDRLTSGTAADLKPCLLADAAYQNKLLRFIENHDEQRAAAVFSPKRQQCSAVVLTTLPGAKLIHEGQIEGRRIKVPVALRRRPPEEPQIILQSFYHRLLNVIGSAPFHNGEWKLCDLKGWPDNSSWLNILAWRRGSSGEEKYLIAVNLSDHRSQAMIQIPWEDIGGSVWRLTDIFSGHEYERDGDQMQEQGLYVDLQGWNYHFFMFQRNSAA